MIISVITPTYNRADSYLPELITSVVESVLDDDVILEHIIVDDASTDTTEQLVKNFQSKYPHIIYLKNTTNLGLSKSRNVGLHQAKGELIIDLDDDDVVPYYSINLRAKLLVQSNNKWLRGNAFQIDEQNQLLNSENLISYPIENKWANFIGFYEGKIFAYSGSKIYYADCLRKIGGWNEKIRNTGEDLDMWLRFSYYFGYPYFCEIPLIFYRKNNKKYGH